MGVTPGLGVSSSSNISDFSVQKRARQITKYLSLERQTILDVGCGNGLYTLKLTDSAKKAVGIDTRHEALREASKNKASLGGDTEFVRALAENLPFPDRSFDIVLAIEVLEHVRSEERAIEEASRVLKDGGWLVVYVPNKLYPFETHGLRIGNKSYSVFHGSVPFLSWAPEFIRRRFVGARIYSKKQIVKLIEGNAFIIRKVDYLYPPLDLIGNVLIKVFLRKFLTHLEQSCYLKKFGMSIFVLAQKRKNLSGV